MENKVCSKCGALTPFYKFNQDKRRKYGLRSECRSCQRKGNTDYQNKIKENLNQNKKLFTKTLNLNKMTKIKNEPIIVQTTKDYSLFKTLIGNRDVNEIHLKRLKESIKANYLTTIIIVNENLEIIDGQHRFLICKELNLPVNYIICNNYGISEIQILNANMKNWSLSDFVNGYCDLGYKDYQIFRHFVNEYNLPLKAAVLILSGEHLSGKNCSFKQGEFKVKNLEESKKIVDKLFSIKPYYNTKDGYLRRVFIETIISLLKNDNFDFNEFIFKLKQQPTKLVHCVNSTQYKALIEEIYNYRRTNKVNLRF